MYLFEFHKTYKFAASSIMLVCPSVQAGMVVFFDCVKIRWRGEVDGGEREVTKCYGLSRK